MRYARPTNVIHSAHCVNGIAQADLSLANDTMVRTHRLSLDSYDCPSEHDQRTYTPMGL